jgi:hypothetical protein
MQLNQTVVDDIKHAQIYSSKVVLNLSAERQVESSLLSRLAAVVGFSELTNLWLVLATKAYRLSQTGQKTSEVYAQPVAYDRLPDPPVTYVVWLLPEFRSGLQTLADGLRWQLAESLNHTIADQLNGNLRLPLSWRLDGELSRHLYEVLDDQTQVRPRLLWSEPDVTLQD